MLKESKPKDDGNEKDFKERLKKYRETQRKLGELGKPNDLEEEYKTILDGYKVTSWIWARLYNYQKTGVRWLLKLHEEYVGGILADEMGLGKSIQTAVFLRTIAESQQPSRLFDHLGLGPVLIIAPATLMHQWVRELNTWFPKCRVAVFHNTGSFSGSRKALLSIMSVPLKNGSILITSYTTYTMFHKDLQKIHWHYVILDEGHKIRNPETKTTISLKEIRTPHRLLLSGSPLQNNLRELWSLIDFVYPGRLGSLKEFTDKFSNPITHGGFANATKLQVRTAYKCACLLRDAINPYMLQRFKKNVEMVLNLPDKSEQILFCDLTPYQRSLYKEYISSKEIKTILAGKLDAFVGLIILRKIANHPDLVTGGLNQVDGCNDLQSIEKEFGAPCRSGKMIVVQSLLKLWYKQKQKILLFSQSKQMLNILEKLVIMLNYNYLRMDGSTPIGSRQTIVQRFNNDESVFVFLLTTRVGGLGLNLTAANRVIIYDPDWNPSTDAQARERAWRIGQNRAVTIYRLVTSGTIEEKIYQRQIFKQFLANRILIDPKQKRFFKTKDLHELFTLGDEGADKEFGTETAAIVSSQSAEINKKNFFDELAKKKRKEKRKKVKEQLKNSDDDEEDISDIDNIEITLTDEYKERLREKAKIYAKLLAENDVVITTMKEIENAQDDQPSSSAQQKSSLTKPAEPAEKEEGEIDAEQEEDSKLSDKSTTTTVVKRDQQDVKESQKAGKKEKRHGKRLLDGKFEIRYLRKQKKYKAGDNKASDKDQDDYVLKHLLEKAGVHSALIHDKIVNESSAERADIQLIEDEANCIAQRAAEILKRSRRQHRNFVEMACVPSNSTRVFGQKSAFPIGDSEPSTSSSSRFSKSNSPANDEEDDGLPEIFNGGMKTWSNNAAASSSERCMMTGSRVNGPMLRGEDLLAMIKKRRCEHLESLEVFEEKPEDVDPETQMYPSLQPKRKKLDIVIDDKYEKLADDIRQFFISRDGCSTSNEVVAKFKSTVPHKDMFVFRSILRKLCHQLPNSHWALRDEYRGL